MTSQTYGQTGEHVFFFSCGTDYSNGHLVIRNRLQSIRILCNITIFCAYCMFSLDHRINILLLKETHRSVGKDACTNKTISTQS